MNSFPMARVAPEKADFRPALPLGFLPGVNGTHMGKMTYSEQLKHPNWQRKRLEVLQAAEFHCDACGDGDTTLHVHHRRYVKGRMAWEYEGRELQALCESCHKDEHERQELFAKALAGFDDVRSAHALIAAFGQGSGQCALNEDDEGALWSGDPNAWRLGHLASLGSVSSHALLRALVQVWTAAASAEDAQRYAAWKARAGIVGGAKPEEMSDARLKATAAFLDLVESMKTGQGAEGEFE